MIKNFGPTLSALGKHKSAVAILLLEVALTCAILCNALFLIQRRLEAISVESGVQEASLLHISLTGIGEQQDAMAQTRTDLSSIKALPGVANASIVSQRSRMKTSSSRSKVVTSLAGVLREGSGNTRISSRLMKPPHLTVSRRSRRA